MSWFDQLEMFMPHGMCLLWQPGLMILHIGSDALIGLAYFAIPFGIAKFVGGRDDLDVKHRYLALLFALFIGLCGITHFTSILVLWYPFYITEGWLKAITAIISVATAIFALLIVPQLLKLPSSKMLQDEIDNHKSTLLALGTARAALALRINLTECDLKEARQNYATSDKILRAVIEAVPGAIYAKDQTGRFVLANRSALEAIGKPWSLVEGRTDHEVLTNELQAASILENDSLVMSSGLVQVMEESVSSSSGITRTYLSTKVPLHNGLNGIGGLVGVSIDITERKRADEEARRIIEGALAEKTQALEQRDILLREVYHRVKNNLQIVDSFLVIQGRLIDHDAARAAIRSLRDRVYALGLVHHQLMTAVDFSTFEISPFLKDLTDNLVCGSASESILVSVNAEPIYAGLDFAIPFGLIVTELVTNSIKHAFAISGGKIDVQVTHGPSGQVVLVVADNGTGTAENQDYRTFPSSGLGSRIVSAMVQQLDGSVQYRHENGTTVEVRVRGPV